MIRLTRMDGEELVVNAELIETVACGADTLVALTTGRRLLVREPADEIVRRAVAYRADVRRAMLAVGCAVEA